MRTRDAFGLAIAPLFLRLMLAAIFLFAGLNKVIHTIEATPEQAAHLANLGAIDGPKPVLPSTDSRVTPLPNPTAPTPIPSPQPTPEPTPEAPADPDPAPAGSDERAPSGIPPLARLALQPDAADPGASEPTPTPTQSPASPVPPAKTYSASDFPGGAKVKPGLMIATMLDDAAHPAPNADGTPRMALWPARLAQKPWPVVMAWTAILTEIIAAALLVFGLFTRLSALGLASTMVVAMWLTEIGPAIQAGTAQFGFLPDYPMMSPQWQHLFFQFSLFASAMALFFLGSGPVGLDAAIFGGPGSATHTRPPRPRKPLTDD